MTVRRQVLRAVRTRCVNGHDLTLPNAIRISKTTGKRRCLRCKKENEALHDDRRQAATARRLHSVGTKPPPVRRMTRDTMAIQILDLWIEHELARPDQRLSIRSQIEHLQMLSGGGKPAPSSRALATNC